MAKFWHRTRKCGCGQCSFSAPIDSQCPQGYKRDAKWLWASCDVEDEANLRDFEARRAEGED